MAKSDVGTITIHLRSEAAQFDAGMKKATKSVGSFQATVTAATGKMTVAWTSLQSKIAIYTGAFETLFKVGAAGSQMMAGDIEKVFQTLKTLPMGIGAVASALNDWYAEFNGYTAVFAEQATQVERLRREYDKLAKTVKGTQAAIKGAQEFASGGNQGGDRLHQQTMEGLGLANEAARVLELRKNVDEYNEVVGKMHDQLKDGRKMWAGFAEQEAAALASSELRAANINKYYDRLEDGMRLERERAALEEKTTSMQELGAQIRSNINSKASHELHLLSIRGAKDEQITARRLKRHQDIAATFKDQNDFMTRQGASQESLDALSAAAHEHAKQGMRDLEVSLESLIAKQREMSDSGPGVTSMSFSTAVGQIVLPDRAQANVTRQQQLIEARRTNTEVAKIVTQITSMQSQMP